MGVHRYRPLTFKMAWRGRAAPGGGGPTPRPGSAAGVVESCARRRTARTPEARRGSVRRQAPGEKRYRCASKSLEHMFLHYGCTRDRNIDHRLRAGFPPRENLFHGRAARSGLLQTSLEGTGRPQELVAGVERIQSTFRMSVSMSDFALIDVTWWEPFGEGSADDPLAPLGEFT